MMNYVGLAMIWLAWAALHSGLLSLRKPLGRRWPGLECRWRLFFAAASMITSLPPAWLTNVMDGPMVVDWPFFWPLVAVNLAALALAWAGLRAFGGLAAFLGFNRRQGACELPRPDKPIDAGVLGWIRHPLYAACLLALWAHDLNAARFVTSCVLTAYVLVGTVIEEKRLEREWGQSWRDYRRRVSAFIPLKKIRSVLTGVSRY